VEFKVVRRKYRRFQVALGFAENDPVGWRGEEEGALRAGSGPGRENGECLTPNPISWEKMKGKKHTLYGSSDLDEGKVKARGI
jgi:hypothetical protein